MIYQAREGTEFQHEHSLTGEVVITDKTGNRVRIPGSDLLAFIAYQYAAPECKIIPRESIVLDVQDNEHALEAAIMSALRLPEKTVVLIGANDRSIQMRLEREGKRVVSLPTGYPYPVGCSFIEVPRPHVDSSAT